MGDKPDRSIPQAARANQIVEKLTPELSLEFAMAAYDNAPRLIEAAAKLHAAGDYGPVRSLAISAREEFGKFFAAMMYCFDLWPAERFADTLREHSCRGRELAFHRERFNRRDAASSKGNVLRH